MNGIKLHCIFTSGPLKLVFYVDSRIKMFDWHSNVEASPSNAKGEFRTRLAFVNEPDTRSSP